MGYRIIGTRPAAAAVPPLFTFGSNGLLSDVLVTTGGSSNTKGSAAVLTAGGGLTAAIDELTLFFPGEAARTFVGDVLLDGVVVVADFLFQVTNGGLAVCRWAISAAIGQEVSIRLSASTGSSTIRCSALGGTAANGGAAGYSAVRPITTTSLTAANNGVSVDVFADAPPTAWAPMIGGSLITSGALNSNIAGLYLFFHPGSDFTRTASRYTIDIATGEPGAEVILLEGIQIVASTSNILGPILGPFRVSVTSGTKLSFRVNAGSAASAAGDTVVCVAHGLVA